MSTKIFNGYKLPKMTIDEFHKFTNDTRKLMESTSLNILEQNMALILVNMIDSLAIGGENLFNELYRSETGFASGHDLYWKTYLHISSMFEKSKKAKTVYNIEYDFTCKAVFIPIKRKFLCLFYAYQDEYIHAWESIHIVKEYSYFNNTDRPSNITKKQWDTRMNDWNIALGGTGIPEQNGFIVNFVTEISPLKLNKDSIIEKMPNIEKRANFQAKRNVYNNLWEIFLNKYGEDNLIHVNYLIEKELKTEKGLSLINKEKTRLLNCLKPQITKDDLVFKI